MATLTWNPSVTNISEFLAVLNQYVQEQTEYMRGVNVEKPTTKTLREQLAK